MAGKSAALSLLLCTLQPSHAANAPVLFPAEICDFGADVDITLCDWSTRNATPGQAHLPRWEGGAGTLSNWIGGPPKDAGGGESTDKGGWLAWRA